MEAQVVLGKITGQERAWLIAHPEASLSDEHAQRYLTMIQRINDGEPLAYITGTREFYGMSFMVTPDVLVPRPDTEELVDAVLAWAEDRQGPLRIVDVGTGCGIIAVTLAVKLPDAEVTAVDLSDTAVDVTRTNASHLGAERVRVLRSDLLAEVAGPFDVIAANLPYIAQPDLVDLSVAKWEPIMALDGGPDGLDLIRAMLAQVPDRLAPGGAIFLEIGYDQGERAYALFQQAFPNADVEIITDLSELDRVIVVRT